MSYVIDGPTIIGDVGTNNTLQGTLTLPQVCTATGDLIYSSNAGGLMTRLAIGTAGQVLTVSGGLLPSWAPAGTPSTTGIAFSAFKSGTQNISSAASSSTTAQITSWSTSSPGYDNTSGLFSSSNFTPTVTGTYLVVCKVAFTDTNNTGSRTLLVVDTTSSTTLAQRQNQPNPDIALNQQLDFSVPLALTSGHVIQLQMTVTSGSTGNTSTILASPSTWWSVIRLS